LNGNDNAYCKFHFVAGEDWQLLDGLEEGITQSSRVTQGGWRSLTEGHQAALYSPLNTSKHNCVFCSLICLQCLVTGKESNLLAGAFACTQAPTKCLCGIFRLMWPIRAQMLMAGPSWLSVCMGLITWAGMWSRATGACIFLPVLGGEIGGMDCGSFCAFMPLILLSYLLARCTVARACGPDHAKRRCLAVGQARAV